MRPQSPGLPPAHGLYDPRFERAACGVAAVADIQGRKSHDIVAKAVAAVKNLAHRGACGCDENSGDGAGILIQTPHKFFAKVCAPLGLRLPGPGEYGVAAVFLPTEADQRRHCEAVMERVVREEGQEVLGWRDVPTDNSPLGYISRSVQPVIRQLFIRRKSARDGDAFERKLYVIRKRAENAIRESDLSQKSYFYVSSCSARTVVYKGMLISHQMDTFYPDLKDPDMESALAISHQRFSTNTFPCWDLAHPFRYIAHNGEINTLRGNINWMHARQSLAWSPLFDDDLKKLFPVITPGGSDTATLDNVVEFLYLGGRSLAHAMMMLIPEPWHGHESMSPEKRAFYEYHACLMEPWDGPAFVAFSDGVRLGAVLDRNGLRPARYVVTKDGLVVLASEVGVLEFPPEQIAAKGRLQPGRMFLVDTEQKRIVEDEELKREIALEHPYQRWLDENLLHLKDLPRVREAQPPDPETLLRRQRAFGYTEEDLRLLMMPMAADGEEAVGSMGIDAPLACLSDKPQLLYTYFKQLFAQVTNPPIDSTREYLVMQTAANIGSERNLLHPEPQSCRQLELEHPILTNEEMEKIRHIEQPGFKAATLPMLFRANEGEKGLQAALEALCRSASEAVEGGANILVLSDRGVDDERAPIPALLATAGVHHHLIREGTRTRVGLVVETGEAREVHHFSLLIGYGAGAINPYLAFETLHDMVARKVLPPDLSCAEAQNRFIKASDKAILKVIAKMGISTIQSYRGAQIFEAVGIGKEVIDRYFTGTVSRVGGVGLDVIAREALARHRAGFPDRPLLRSVLPSGGRHQWRADGEYHLWNPETIAKLQHSVRSGNYRLFKEFTRLVDEQSRHLCTLRGLFELKYADRPIPLEEVEPATEIVKRFATGAMSYGSISKEAHETLAIAMNRLGGKSNTGEGGEDPERYKRLPNGDSKRSAIKQVASARFGVTSEYLVQSDELQIKMAQGAKPGEGGQLPARKVYPWIAKVRHSTPFVGLISPPPHHDIYSIEDLKQLIYDLKNGNVHARISVKLVAEVGVGIVAAGVAKAKSDVVLISGHDGGTGASPITSIHHAGIPWEIGLAETQQVLVMNDLRGRIVVQTDGKLMTGRDIAIATLLGAEEWGCATASLVSAGCIMMRVCHLDTCPVGVATQNPELRKKFPGQPEHVVNFFLFLAEELREHMARLGFRTIAEMVGRVDRIDARKAVDHWKARGLDFSAILAKPEAGPSIAIRRVREQDHELAGCLDEGLLEICKPALERREPVKATLRIVNSNRTVGTILSSEITRRYGPDALPEDTVQLTFHGSAGQSFGAWAVPGVTLRLEGDANDYIGKGLSGGKIIVVPPKGSTFVPEENILIGNVALYGATAGEGYFRGVAGERFCVRNSGARVVVEGVGDHGCEYMTGGRAVILGKTGRNFAAGMSGGIAYVLDEAGDFENRCNPEMVDLEPVTDPEDEATIQGLVEKHVRHTGSAVGKRVLDRWEQMVPLFVKVMPRDYKRALEQAKKESQAAAPQRAAA
ncbi:MAG: glutamate synthase large subunit [Halobacteria archaeon]